MHADWISSRISRVLCRRIAASFPALFLFAMFLFPFQVFSQDTAYPAVDAQIPGPAKSSDRQTWLEDLRRWRIERRDRIGFDDSNYKRPEFQWTRRNFVCTQMMIEERDFFDRDKMRYTVDRFLDRLEKSFGGIDSVLVWNTYPNLGVDDRNQFDRLRDMPGGISGVKQMVADFHRRGVKVLFPETPWDLGTRDEGAKDWDAQARLMKEVGADGVLGDTVDGMPGVYLRASIAEHYPLALQPEGLPPEETLAWNEMTWGYWDYPFVPMISRYKWLETRHMPVLTSGGRHHLNGIQAAFFNGVGFAHQEDVVGIHNGLTAREAEALRRVMMIERAFAPLLVSPDWHPHAPTVQEGVFASRFPGADQTLWTIINRNQYGANGRQISVPAGTRVRYYDLWHGTELQPVADSNNTATLNFDMEAMGFGAILEVRSGNVSAAVENLLAEMRTRSSKQLAEYSDEWNVEKQSMVEIASVPPVSTPPSDMVLIPEGTFEFKVDGVAGAGGNQPGVDVQYSWEDAPRRSHNHTMTIPRFFIDRYPVTNAQFKQFLNATHYHPFDDHNFLRDWHEGNYPSGWDRKPVTWVSIEDARAYAKWAGKRLPNEWEWQYAAQGRDGRLYPWGNQWDPEVVPKPDLLRRLTSPDDVNSHPRGASPFGVMDMVGNVWQWTNEFEDTHIRSAILRGGSYFQPKWSAWYFPQAYRLNQHGRYLLMTPGMDRSGTVGFRCAADAK